MDVIRDKIINLFEKYEMPEDTQERILQALDIVWQKDSEQKIQNIVSARKAIAELKSVVKQHAESVTDPTNSSIKDELVEIIQEKKAKIAELETDADRLTSEDEQDKRQFMEFALSFIAETGQHFLEPYITKENRLRCKQMLFPGGIRIEGKEKVYTPELSVFYRLAEKKKDAKASDNSHLVRVRGL